LFIVNLLRSIVFAVAAAFLIFTQDHSVKTGALALGFIAATLSIAGALAMILSKDKKIYSALVIPTVSAFAVLVFLLSANNFLGLQNDETGLLFFRAAVTVFTFGLAWTEFRLSAKADPGERLELRISAALAALAALVFMAMPLNDVNAVGLLSAYLALSAAQRGVWLATPGKQVRNGKN